MNIFRYKRLPGQMVSKVICVASVSVRFMRKERGTRVKDRAKMAQVKKRVGVGKKGRKRLQTRGVCVKPKYIYFLYFGTRGRR